MLANEPFQLQSKPRRKAPQFENNINGRQKRLFVGVNDLPGQQSLFDADGFETDDDEPIPALTVQQPWASAIVAGDKRVENRSWSTDYRGPLLIHASSKPARRGATATLAAAGVLADENGPRGAVIGIVDLVDVVPVQQRTLFDDASGDPLATGPYCWILANPRPLTRPVPYAGQLGMYAIPRSALGSALPRD